MHYEYMKLLIGYILLFRKELKCLKTGEVN